MPSTTSSGANEAKLIALIYQGVEEKQPWFAFVDALAESVQAHDASLLIYSKRWGRFYYHVTSDRHFYWTEKTLLAVMDASYMMAIDAPTPMTESEWGRIPDFYESTLFKQFLAPIGVTHILMHDARNDDSVVVRFVTTRSDKQKSFGAAERGLMERLAPHLKQATLLRERLQRHALLEETLQDMIVRMGVGCIVLDSQRRVVACNALARAQLEGDRDLQIEDDRLQLRGDGETSALDQAIEAALQAHSQQAAFAPVTVNWHSGGLELIIKAVPARAPSRSDSEPAAMLLFQSGGENFTGAEETLLREKYGLSKSEASLGVLLARGHTLGEAAVLRGVSLNTIKTHLRSMYEKLGLHRRSQLISLLSQNTNKLL